MTEFIVHRVAPISRALILHRPPPLKAEPCPFRSFHIAAAHPRLIVERKLDPAVFLVSSQVKFGNDLSNNLLVQAFCIFKREVLEAAFEIGTPLAHNVV